MDSTGRAIETNEIEPLSTLDRRPSPKPQEDHPEPAKTIEEASSTTTAPSSPPPTDRGVFSSDAIQSESELSSVPSSPPRLPSPMLKIRKPAFSFLKRKRSENDDGSSAMPLNDITANAQKGRKAAKKALTQMQIDLGGDIRKKCRMCGMEYIPSVAEDAALHKDFCATKAAGVDVGRAFVRDETVKILRPQGRLTGQREAVVLVDKRSSSTARNKFQSVLSIVNSELGGVQIPEEQLWGDYDVEMVESKSESRRRGFHGQERKQDHFKGFLHVIDGRCIGLCLAQKISNAFPVVDSDKIIPTSFSIAPVESSSISHSESADVVLLGISRIWISRTFRHQGLARNLLECARNDFFYGVQVPRHLVAFSQPTESGTRLARRWFGAENGWHVYDYDFSQEAKHR